MDILRWLVSVLRHVVGRTPEPEVPKERRLLGHHEGIALYAVKDDPRVGDVAVVAQLEWVFGWTDRRGVRNVRAWITTRDTSRACGCGCGHSCDSDHGAMRVVLDYPYNNGGEVVERNLPDFATALQAARSAAERDIDTVLAENREELAQKQQISQSQVEFRQGVAQMFGAPVPNESSEATDGEDWSKVFEDLQAAPPASQADAPATVEARADG